jgi:hypothetical protein
VKRLLVSLALAAAQVAAGAENPQVSRAVLADLERKLDRTIPALETTDPYDLLGTARGVYLPGYGAVFTTELNLLAANYSPFNPPPTGEGLEKLRQRKLARLPLLKRSMRALLVMAAVTLKTVPPNEQIVLGISLYYKSFENRDGLPSQIVMQAPRQTLLDLQLERPDSPKLEKAIRVQEL